MTSRNVDEYSVCVPKHDVKMYNVMRFNAGDKIDIRNWINGSLSRDMSAKKIYEDDEVYPEFGEGSEYGRKRREEARRLKYGIRKSKFKESDQPWNLSFTTIDTQSDIKKKANGKNEKKPKIITKEYRGKKEGGIGEGSMYFIFTQRPDFTFEAHPVEDWYNFRRKIQHRTLTDEEAEAAWDKRDKIVNHLNFMARKRLHITDEDEEEVADPGSKSSQRGGKQEKSSNLVIHDNEDYDLYMSGDSSDEEGSDKEGKKKQKKAKKAKPSEDDEEKTEAGEDSDDGEHDGTEIAYASDVSSENEESVDSKVVPRGLDELTSSSSSEDEEESKEKLDTNAPEKKDEKKDSDNSSASGDSDSDIDEDDSLSKSALFMQRKKTSPKDKKMTKDSRPGSRSSTPNSELAGARSKLLDSTKKFDEKGRRSPFGKSLLGKRHAGGGSDEVRAKQSKSSQGSSRTSTPTKELLQQGITEEAVKRYLTFKPMTTKDLLKKFKTKKTGLSSEKIVEKVANILKKLNPQQSKINGTLHLYLKAT